METERSEFRSRDLKLLGNMLSDPLTRAVRTGILDFHGLVWCAEMKKNLAKFGDGWSNAITVAIRRGKLDFTRTLDWSSELQGLEKIFNLKRGDLHIFRNEPSMNDAGITLTEPQATFGLARYLDHPDRSVKEGRVRAFLNALGESNFGGNLEGVTIMSEERTKHHKRIDLFIKWQDEYKKDYALVIEAKFGHNSVGTGQLRYYRQHVSNIAKNRRLLVLIVKHLSSRIDKALQRNKEWRIATWQDFLISYERILQVRDDDINFVRFRRNLWNIS